MKVNTGAIRGLVSAVLALLAAAAFTVTPASPASAAAGWWRISSRYSSEPHIGSAYTSDPNPAVTVDTSVDTYTNWAFDQLSSGYYHLRQRATGKCMNVPNGATANNVQVIVYTCQSNSSYNDQWELARVYTDAYGTDYYHLINRQSGKCLNLKSGLTSNGTPIVQYGCQGASGLNDQWTWTAVS